jgi:hypothetical protein
MKVRLVSSVVFTPLRVVRIPVLDVVTFDLVDGYVIFRVPILAFERLQIKYELFAWS